MALSLQAPAQTKLRHGAVGVQHRSVATSDRGSRCRKARCAKRSAARASGNCDGQCSACRAACAHHGAPLHGASRRSTARTAVQGSSGAVTAQRSLAAQRSPRGKSWCTPSAAQHSTAQHGTAQHGTARHSTAQHDAAPLAAQLTRQHGAAGRCSQHGPASTWR
jgi:hypothetical protein